MKRLSKLKHQVSEPPPVSDKSKSAIVQPPSDALRGLQAACSFMGDTAQAIQMVQEQAGLVFDRERSEDLALAFEEVQLGKDHALSEDTLATLRQELAQTKPYVSGPSLPDKGASNKIPFKDWRRQDLGLLVFLSAMTLLAMVISTSNVYANIMASEEPVYLEMPILALLIALLAPCGSAAIKLTSNILTNDTQRIWFRRGLFCLSGISFGVWVAAFSTIFDGVGAGLDWDAVLEGGGKGGAFFVFIQTLSEILIAASLFTALQDLLDKYDPEKLSSNPSYALIEQRYQTHLAAHAELTKRYHSIKARQAAYKAARQSYVNEQTAAFAVTQAKHKNLYTS